MRTAIMRNVNPDDKRIESRVRKVQKLKNHIVNGLVEHGKNNLEWKNIQNIPIHKKLLTTYLIRQFNKEI